MGSSRYIHLKDFIIPDRTPAARVTEMLVRLGTRKTMMVDSILSSAQYNYAKEGMPIDQRAGWSVLPYASYSTVSLSSGGTDIKARTNGVMVMLHAPLAEGNDLLTGYLGYDSTDVDDDNYGSVAKATARDTTVYAGMKYLHSLAENGTYRWFSTIDAKASHTGTDLSYESTAGSLKESLRVLGAQVSAMGGVRIALSPADSLTARMGLGYEYLNTDKFFFFLENPSQNVHLAFAEGSANWVRQWIPGLSTVATAGAKSYLNPKVHVETIGDKARIELPPIYGYGRFGLMIEPSENMNFSFNYSGTYSNDGETHSLFAKFNYRF